MRIKNRTIIVILVLWITLIVFINKIPNKITESFVQKDETKFLDIMNSRTTLVSHVCSLAYPTRKADYLRTSNIYWLRNQNVAYCPIFKSATSTWRSHLVNLLNNSYVGDSSLLLDENISQPIGVHEKLMQLGAVKPKSKEFMKFINALPEKHNFTGFIVVRHPFDRLVSAFRDKLERNLEDPYYYDNFGRHFVDKYRTQAIKELGIEYFDEGNNFGTPMKVLNNRRPNADLPSFWEFVQAIIDRYRMDEHWVPIYQFCSICNPTAMKGFRYILKFEQLETEEMMFLNHVKWSVHGQQLRKLNANHPDDLPAEKLTQLYFSILSKEQIFNLYQVYELDFLLFNYTFTIEDIHLPSSYQSIPI